MSDTWIAMRAATRARIGLGRAGDAPPLKPVLDFQAAHALARDAVHATVDWDALAASLAPLPTIRVASAAPDRASYLRRPDLGRRLAPGCGLAKDEYDIAFVIADGLSAAAVGAHAAPVVRACIEHLADWKVAPVVLAEQGRVAIGDAVGAALGTAMVAVLIGERPGLSAADSLGAYLTWQPRPGRSNAERNCISNIHGAGLSPAEAAASLAWLACEARQRGLTGIALKDESGAPEASRIPKL